MQPALKEDWEPANDNQSFIGLTMQQIENLPIYFHTDDQRINAFLQKNRLHHELFGGRQIAKPLNIRMAKGGNGRIRGFLLICAVVVLYLYFALQAWGWM